MYEAPTKAGKTVGCMAWLGEQAIKGRDGQPPFRLAPHPSLMHDTYVT